jgi:hypothetical protein
LDPSPTLTPVPAASDWINRLGCRHHRPRAGSPDTGSSHQENLERSQHGVGLQRRPPGHPAETAGGVLPVVAVNRSGRRTTPRRAAQGVPERSTRADAELREDAVQMPTHCPWRDVQPAAGLLVGEPNAASMAICCSWAVSAPPRDPPVRRGAPSPWPAARSASGWPMDGRPRRGRCPVPRRAAADSRAGTSWAQRHPSRGPSVHRSGVDPTCSSPSLWSRSQADRSTGESAMPYNVCERAAMYLAYSTCWKVRASCP